jgi:hypothetical protein
VSILDWLNLAGWTCIWTFVMTILLGGFYMNFYERRWGYPSRRHRFVIAVLLGPLAWLIFTWFALEDSGG